jgi:signal transduction histidine kinase
MEKVGQLGWWEMDWKTKEVFWSPGFHIILGTDPNQFKPVFKIGLPLLIDESIEQFEKLIAAAELNQNIDGDYEIFTRPVDGVKKSLLFSIRTEWSDGKISKIFGILRDITREANQKESLRQSNKDLQAQNERLNLAKKSVGFGVWDWNIKSQQINWDQDLYRLYGSDSNSSLDPDQIFKNILNEEDYHFIASNAQEVFKKGDKQYVLQYRLKTQPVRYIKTLGRVFYDDQKQPERVVGFSWDVTSEVEAEKLLQEQFTQIVATAKLASLGEMAGNMAHEINNPLAIISGRVGLMKIRLQKHPELIQLFEDDLNIISSTVKRIATIINGVRSFTRDPSEDPLAQASLLQIIEETLSFCKAKLSFNSIQIKLEIEEDLSVFCRASQISQILLNLIQNSMEAISSNKDDKWIKISLQKNIENKIELSVIDSGFISAEIAQDAMRPFFTTKKQGQGTGIGLNICRKLAAANNARLILASQEPQNTAFKLIFN